MTSLTDSPNPPNLEHAQQELRAGIESSREMVRQSFLLIELAESEGVEAANDNVCELAD